MVRQSQSGPRGAGEMPRLGLGTWQNDDPEQCAASVRTALEVGYRHVDTAQVYENEAAVGEGIDGAAVPREEIFLATKIRRHNYGHDDVIRSTRESLDRLGVDSVDLMYVHWPIHGYEPTETLPALEELRAKGLVDRIGVSNFEPEHVERAVEVLAEPPFANQIEMHPLLPQEELRRVCADHDVGIVAYSPLAHGRIFDVPELQEVAEKHDVSVAQVSLAWLREKGVTAIPKATSEAHIRDNWASLDLDLDDDELEEIDGIERTDRQNDPGYAPW